MFGLGDIQNSMPYSEYSITAKDAGFHASSNQNSYRNKSQNRSNYKSGRKDDTKINTVSERTGAEQSPSSSLKQKQQ